MRGLGVDSASDAETRHSARCARRPLPMGEVKNAKRSGPINLVRVPRMSHWEINAWYQTSNRKYDWMTPREYLHGKDWDERRRVGLDALTRYGVLKP